MAEPFQKGGVWYARIKNEAGRWRNIALPEAKTKAAARAYAAELALHKRRQRDASGAISRLHRVHCRRRGVTRGGDIGGHRRAWPGRTGYDHAQYVEGSIHAGNADECDTMKAEMRRASSLNVLSGDSTLPARYSIRRLPRYQGTRSSPAEDLDDPATEGER